jgi:transcriptional regulator with XRE-family HTH domain
VINIERFDGGKELQELLKKFIVHPTNVEITDRTGIPRSTVSDFMSGKKPPSRKVIEKFKKGFGITDDQPTPPKTEKPPSTDSGLKDKLISILENSLKRVEAELDRVIQENERLKNK